MVIADTSAFEAKVTAEGYEVFRKTLGPEEGLGDHAHDYDVWGLVTAGEFRISCGGSTRSYRAGEEFLLAAESEHSEAAGPEGCSFVVGRRANRT